MNSALIDTNLLLLLIVGATERDYIGKHKRTKQFTVEDYDLLLSQLERFKQLWVTSHCLAETSNLVNQSSSQVASRIMKNMGYLCGTFSESHMKKEIVCSDSELARLGIADVGFVRKSKSVSCSFTVDHDLYQSISRLGRKVVNLNHLRIAHLL
jgi:hypothetical protein